MMLCPFCQSENAPLALVCASCARDIAVPKSLLAERDDLLRKRDLLRQKLVAATAELEKLRRGKKRRSV
jgi:hypothetical protein